MSYPPPTDDKDYVAELNEFLAKLSDDPERDQAKSEIEVLMTVTPRHNPRSMITEVRSRPLTPIEMDSPMPEATSGAKLGPMSAFPSSTPTPDAPQNELASLNDILNNDARVYNWPHVLQEAAEDPRKMTTILSTVLAYIIDSSKKEVTRLVEDFNQKERQQWEGIIRMCMQSGDWTDLITHPTNLRPRLPSGSSGDKTRKVKILEIDALEPLIRKTLDIIRPTIESFLEKPELPDWVPPPYTNPSFSEFLRDLRIPAYRNRAPSLLYHDLHLHHDDDVVEKIFGGAITFVCNTSGSGKTRRLLEGLTKSWGLYFVAVRDNNSVGVDDLEAALGDVGRYEDWTVDIRLYEGQDQTDRNASNIHISNRAIRKVFAARLVVFKLFLQLVKARNGDVGPEHKRLWLLFQLSNPLPGLVDFHPFVTMKKCLNRASDGALTTLIEDFDQIRMQYFPGSRFMIALDEAQQAVRLHRFCFLSSSREPTKFRSILREIVKVFSSSAVKIVVSGTGLSLEEVEDSLNSSVGKPLGQFETFVELGMLDDPLKLEATLRRYIPPPILESPSGKSLQMRIREYLPGRYRFLISFLELFMGNGLESPHTLLNKYIARYMDCSPGDMDFYSTVTSREPPLQVEPMVRTFDWERLRENPSEIREVASIVQSHLIKKSTPTFGPLAHKYVEYGIARLRKDHRGEIIEPLAFLSIVRWLETQNDISLEANLRLPPAVGISVDTRLGFQVPWRRPKWADMSAQMVARMEGGDVVVNVLENPPRYPSLGVVYYASTIEDIIRWFEGSPAPSVLVPTHLFGPDVIIKCTGDLYLIGQTKSCLTGNINELNVTTTEDAINSLNSANWFIKTKSQSRRKKLIDTITRFPRLFFLAGFPLPANLDLATDSVKKAVSDLGPVPLATIPLDTFRAKFISPGEVKNVLQPMEHALARQRDLDTMMH